MQKKAKNLFIDIILGNVKLLKNKIDNINGMIFAKDNNLRGIDVNNRTSKKPTKAKQKSPERIKRSGPFMVEI